MEIRAQSAVNIKRFKSACPAKPYEYLCFRVWKPGRAPAWMKGFKLVSCWSAILSDDTARVTGRRSTLVPLLLDRPCRDKDFPDKQSHRSFWEVLDAAGAGISA
jgi:hypothetical protein